MSEKYEITNIQHPEWRFLRRIRALRDIPRYGVEAGDLGGWVEKEYNLSQDGNAWVGEQATAFENSLVDEDSAVLGHARVGGKVVTSGNALIGGDVSLSGVEQFGWDDDVRSGEEFMFVEVAASKMFRAALCRTKHGHRLHVGCWRGTVPKFRTMIESDRWVEATPKEIKLRRPELIAFTAMCEARIATWEPRT